MQPSGKYSNSVVYHADAYIGWGIIAVLCAIPAVFWISLHNSGSINSFSGMAFSIGQLAGLVGLVLYSINLVLTTRLKFLENLFGGLNRVYIAHHIIGALALFCLAFHPLMLALRFVGTSAYDAVLLLLPNGLVPVNSLFNTSAQDHTSVLHQWAIFFGIIAFWGLVVLLLVTFFINLPYKIWLFIHKFLGVAFFFAGLHVLFVGSDLSRSPALKVYLLGLVVVGLMAFLYKTLAGNILIRKYGYALESVKTVGGNVSELLLTPQNKSLSHQPGQFVFVRFPKSIGVKKEWHPFSISSAPNAKSLRFNIKSLGDYTASLINLKPGDIVEVEGAYGRFSYTRFKNPNQIWIAGGIGITPFLSMASNLDNNSHNISLFYCVGSPSELVDWQQLNQMSKNKTNFRLFTYVKTKNKLYLTAKQIDKTVGGLDGKEIFICGPPAMMNSLRQQFRSLNIPAHKIHTEEFALS